MWGKVEIGSRQRIKRNIEKIAEKIAFILSEIESKPLKLDAQAAGSEQLGWTIWDDGTPRETR